MKHFNFSLFVFGIVAGLLVGVLTSRPVTWITLGVVAGVALAFTIRPKKKSCCQ